MTPGLAPAGGLERVRLTMSLVNLGAVSLWCANGSGLAATPWAAGIGLVLCAAQLALATLAMGSPRTSWRDTSGWRWGVRAVLDLGVPAYGLALGGAWTAALGGPLLVAAADRARAPAGLGWLGPVGGAAAFLLAAVFSDFWGTHPALTGGLALAVVLIPMANRAVLTPQLRELARERGRNSAAMDNLASLSHDLRGPLGAIAANAEMLDGDVPEEERAWMLSSMRAASRTVVGVADQMLAASALDAGRLAVTPEAVDTLELVEEVRAGLDVTARETGLGLVNHVGAEALGTWRLDGRLVRQILFNLVANALKFTRTGGVVLQVSRQNGALVFGVIDSGPGIDAAHRETVFERHQRAAGAGAVEGSGLGLAISRELARAMGGDVALVSAGGEGCAFRVTVPACPARQESAGAGESRAVSLSPCGRAGWLPAVRDAQARCEGGQVVRVLGPGETPACLSAHQREPVVWIGGAPSVSAHEIAGLGGCWVHLGEAATAEELLSAAAAVSATGAPDGGFVRAHRCARILLVEDGRVNADVGRRILARAGHQVAVAGTGTEALSRLATGSFDAAVIDVRLPDIDGTEVARAIGVRPEIASVPMLALTGAATPDVRRLCHEAGMHDVLSKPVCARKLVQRLDRLLRDAPAGDRQRAGAAEAVVDRRAVEQLRALDDDQGFGARLTDVFLSDTKQQISELRRAGAAGDVDQIAAICHAMRSASGNMGALRVRQIAAGVMQDRDAGPERVEVTCDQLDTELTRYAAAIRDLAPGDRVRGAGGAEPSAAKG